LVGEVYKEHIQNTVGCCSVQGTYTEYSWLVKCTRNIYRIQLVAAVYKEHIQNTTGCCSVQGTHAEPAKQKSSVQSHMI